MNFLSHRMIFCLAMLSTALVAGVRGVSQEPVVSDAASDNISLQVGDRAPTLAVDHWLGGGEVPSFSQGTVYVVEFWATWCAPCINSMPHLSELAERYSKDGLVVVAITQADEANTLEAVEEFIKGPGKEFRFRYAMCESDATHRAYMEAAGQKGIPCSFVIDREGNVAYVGHPDDLDYVLERLTSGKWRGKADADELREMNESVANLGALVQSNPDKALQIVEHIRRVNPHRAKSLDFAYAEVMVLCHNKMFDRAKELIESSSQGADSGEDWGATAMLSGLLTSKDLNPEGKHFDFAVAQLQAAENALKDDWQYLLQVSVAYQLSGNIAKHKECMARVIELCPNEQIKKSLQLALEMQLPAGGK